MGDQNASIPNLETTGILPLEYPTAPFLHERHDSNTGKRKIPDDFIMESETASASFPAPAFRRTPKSQTTGATTLLSSTPTTPIVIIDDDPIDGDAAIVSVSGPPGFSKVQTPSTPPKTPGPSSTAPSVPNTTLSTPNTTLSTPNTAFPHPDPNDGDDDIQLIKSEVIPKKEVPSTGKLRLTRNLTVKLHGGDYLKINRIVKRMYMTNDEYILIGSLFRRTKFLKVLPRKLNEVARVHKRIEVPVEDVEDIRDLILTNKPFPECRDVREASEGGRLVCRWVYNINEQAKGKEHKRVYYVRRVGEAEADEAHRMEDKELREKWHQDGYTGDDIEFDFGEGQNANDELFARELDQEINGDDDDLDVIEVDRHGADEGFQQRRRPTPTTQTEAEKQANIPPAVPYSYTRKTYTFGDTFCGGGGVSLGARMAGLQVKWAMDMNTNARDTYMLNFPETEFYHATAEQFFHLNNPRAPSVDVLHLSPPCQTFSRAHTIAGRNDDHNEASFFAVVNLVKIVRPRFFTIEETDGILDRAKRAFIETALQGITELGYSFTYSSLNSIEFGCCQRRNRLIVIGAAPGEPLPPFPDPTHQDYFSSNPRLDLLPSVTLAQALSTITPASTDHEFNHVWPPEAYKPAYDIDRPFKNAIRAGGGEYDVYPDGTRKFTVRELACIQGFPDEYRFVGTLTDKRKVIGNAVSPPLSKALMVCLRDWMERLDFERMV